jgi:hypothetical protein
MSNPAFLPLTRVSCLYTWLFCLCLPCCRCPLQRKSRSPLTYPTRLASSHFQFHLSFFPLYIFAIIVSECSFHPTFIFVFINNYLCVEIFKCTPNDLKPVWSIVPAIVLLFHGKCLTVTRRLSWFIRFDLVSFLPRRILFEQHSRVNQFRMWWVKFNLWNFWAIRDLKYDE